MNRRLPGCSPLGRGVALSDNGCVRTSPGPPHGRQGLLLRAHPSVDPNHLDYPRPCLRPLDRLSWKSSVIGTGMVAGRGRTPSSLRLAASFERRVPAYGSPFGALGGQVPALPCWPSRQATWRACYPFLEHGTRCGVTAPSAHGTQLLRLPSSGLRPPQRPRRGLSRLTAPRECALRLAACWEAASASHSYRGCLHERQH